MDYTPRVTRAVALLTGVLMVASGCSGEREIVRTGTVAAPATPEPTALTATVRDTDDSPEIERPDERTQPPPTTAANSSEPLEIFESGVLRCYAEGVESVTAEMSPDVEGHASIDEALDDWWQRIGENLIERAALVGAVDDNSATYADAAGNAQLVVSYARVRNDTLAITGSSICSQRTSPFVDGPVLTSPQPPSEELDGLAAEIHGTLVLTAGCLLLDPDDGTSEDVRYPPIWPAGTSWQAHPPGVVLPTGEHVPIGAAVSGGGGYPKGENLRWDPLLTAIASACAGPTAEVASFNPGGAILVTQPPTFGTQASCGGGSRFPVEVLDGLGAFPEASGETLRRIQPHQLDEPEDSWRIVVESPSLLALRGDVASGDLDFILFFPDGRLDATGPCRAHLVPPAGLHRVEFDLDPTVDQPDASSLEVAVVLDELICGGNDATLLERLREPGITYDQDAIVVSLFAEDLPPGPDEYACADPGPVPTTLALTEPVGGRRIHDGSTIPPIAVPRSSPW